MEAQHKSKVLPPVPTAQTHPENTYELPISLLLAIVNELAPGSPTRERVTGYIGAQKDHVSAGFYIRPDGLLAFDRDLLWESIYRGKIQTYLRAAKDAHDKMCKELEMVRGFHADHAGRLKRLPPELLDSRLGAGKPLSLEAQALFEKLLPLLGEQKDAGEEPGSSEE